MQVSKRRLFGIALTSIIASILLTSTAFYVFALSASTSLYVESGIYPGAPAYTLWGEDSTYYAKDSNGYIEFSGSNASEVHQNCINTFTAWGGTIQLIGDLTYTHSIIIDDTIYPVRTTGDGWSTRVTYTGSEYWLISTGDNQKFHKVDNLQIKLGSSAKGGIHLGSGSFYWDIEHVTFYGVVGSGYWNYGIVLNRTGVGVYWNRIDSCRFYDLNVSISIEGGANGNHIIDPIIRSPQTIGIQLLMGNAITITGGRIEGLQSAVGVYANTSYNTFYGLNFELSHATTYGYNFSTNAEHNRIFGGRFNIAGTYLTNAGEDNLLIGDLNYAWTRNGSYPTGINEGQFCYRVDLDHLYVYNGTDWLQVDN